jgi:hypothetical protein
MKIDDISAQALIAYTVYSTYMIIISRVRPIIAPLIREDNAIHFFGPSLSTIIPHTGYIQTAGNHSSMKVNPAFEGLPVLCKTIRGTAKINKDSAVLPKNMDAIKGK